jgi:hypothetical protein
MNPFLFILAYLFSVTSLKSLTPNLSTIKPKLCKNCAFFTKDFFTTTKFGKCALFPKEEYKPTNKYYLVDGMKVVNNVDYYFCATARECDHMCGIEGKLYQKREQNPEKEF